jgi:hypothetical protein
VRGRRIATMLGFLEIFGRSRHLLRADKQAI